MGLSAIKIGKTKFYVYSLFPFFFLFIYSVKINLIPNFSYLGILLFPALIFVIPGLNGVFFSILRSKELWWLVLTFLVLIFITLFFSFAHATAELKIAYTILHSLFSIPACIVISSILCFTLRDEPLRPISNFLGFLLKSQVLLILLMLISPDFRELIVDIARTDSQKQRMSVYQGARGLGLSGSIAFGLSTYLAVNYLIYFYLKYLVNGQKFKIHDYIWIFLSALALMSAGRTAILGVIALPVILFFYSVQYRQFSAVKIFLSIICFAILCFIFYVFFEAVAIENEAISRFVFYVFQPVELYLRTGSFEVSSVEALNNMYYYPGMRSFLLGDGLYMSPSGGYYKNVDAGYMRYILYGGIFYVALFLIIFSIFIYIFNSSVKSSLRGAHWLLVAIFFMSAIFHYKGEFLLISVYVNKLIFVVIFYFLGVSRLMKSS